MTDPLPVSGDPDHVKARRKERKLYARASMAYLILLALYVPLAAVFIDGAAGSLQTVAGVLAPLTGFLTAIVGGYLAVGHLENQKAAK